ncbi:MAG: hypothetical protein MI924_02370 [Chloroflexales bacterium]|nr:hypothetical protein [Chloroflexales bacterium]
MYPIHPFTVHFPIALLLANGLLTILYLRQREPSLETSAYHCLALGWLGACLATVSGLIDAVRQLAGPESPRDNALIGWVNAHAIVGVATVVVYGQALRRRRQHPAILDDQHARKGYLRLLVFGSLLIVLNGWLGGHLVYVLRLGVGQ